MEWLFAWLPVLGCGVMMLVCMKLMGGQGKKSDHAATDAQSSTDAEALRARVAELERRLEVESNASAKSSEAAPS